MRDGSGAQPVYRAFSCILRFSPLSENPDASEKLPADVGGSPSSPSAVGATAPVQGSLAAVCDSALGLSLRWKS